MLPKYRYFRNRCLLYEAECTTGRAIRIQRLLALMVVLYALCWLPINILNIVTHFVYETSDNTHHFDISYMCLTLVGYLSTCVNPMFALVLVRVVEACIANVNDTRALLVQEELELLVPQPVRRAKHGLDLPAKPTDRVSLPLQAGARFRRRDIVRRHAHSLRPPG